VSLPPPDRCQSNKILKDRRRPTSAPARRRAPRTAINDGIVISGDIRTARPRPDTFLTLVCTNILTQRPAQTCLSPRQRRESWPFAYRRLGPRQSPASATIKKTSESVSRRQCATDRRERNMKTYQISDDRLVVLKKNLVVIKQKDSDKSFDLAGWCYTCL